MIINIIYNLNFFKIKRLGKFISTIDNKFQLHVRFIDNESQLHIMFVGNESSLHIKFIDNEFQLNGDFIDADCQFAIHFFITNDNESHLVRD